MANISFLMQKGNMGFFEVMELPYAVFLSLLKHFKIFELQQDPEYIKQLEQQKVLEKTEPDWDKVRNFAERRG